MPDINKVLINEDVDMDAPPEIGSGSTPIGSLLVANFVVDTMENVVELGNNAELDIKHATMPLRSYRLQKEVTLKKKPLMFLRYNDASELANQRAQIQDALVGQIKELNSSINSNNQSIDGEDGREKLERRQKRSRYKGAEAVDDKGVFFVDSD
ncbi:hypothetical protein BX616_010669 [Lobosporangium transversale]|uniref:Uncharacterized protein n=1 Tax=Lobosporangium transversale TaxID=64571 RepID=A0A1Y2H5Z5_9FUNG|nr:hypothetical protein BCR41DRAFT_391534 [Lobosporangium transversale]KAF9911086.1 hypothetical protein BX616_010669 [Lobosporangium transversale]ORZ29123.1 hypothetical protein BCR41DRAFT_391534 [Lobosporangium transversale]|eukprot:XP_021886796.1 hypothetical protein BCR41DRAFT_391534 [Lobosporangium transversale]